MSHIATNFIPSILLIKRIKPCPLDPVPITPILTSLTRFLLSIENISVLALTNGIGEAIIDFFKKDLRDAIRR